MALHELPAILTLADSLPGVPHWSRSNYQAALNPANPTPRIALVAEANKGILAGFAVASLAGPEAELESIAVAPSWQRQGIARGLFRHLARQLCARGVDKVFLEVRASNLPARNLYISLGFAELGRRKSYYADPPEDAILLCLGPLSDVLKRPSRT